MKKRYKLTDPENHIYNDFYCRYQTESLVLNSGAEKVPSMYSIFWDKTNLENELRKLVGDEQGLYNDAGGEKKFAFIPFTKEALSSIEQQFENFCYSHTSRGKATPTQWPKDLLMKKLQYEARMDVASGEVEMIEKRLKEMEDVVQKAEDARVLANGPRGISQLLDGVIISVDGMAVKEIDGVLCINDDREKAKRFDGYATADYFTYVVDEWAWARNKKAKETQEQAKRDGIPLNTIPKGKLIGSNAPWPEMPESCVNYKSKKYSGAGL